MSTDVDIRPIRAADLDAVAQLWDDGGVGIDPATDRAELQRMVDFGAPYLLVAVEPAAGTVVGSIMGTFDGHRGRIKRAVVHPDRRGDGLGRRLVDDLEARFLADGITELRLEVWAGNTGGLAFWHELGWELLEDIRYFQRSLD